MATVEQISLWSVDDALLNIKILLPEGWVINTAYDATSKLHSVEVLNMEDPQSEFGYSQWSGESFDLRVLLLDCYGWLVLRDAPNSSSPMWSRARDPLPKVTKTVTLGGQGTDSDDPGDLDPEEIRRLLRDR